MRQWRSAEGTLRHLRISIARMLVAALAALIVATVMARQSLDAAGACEELSKLTLPGATITLAESIDAAASALPVQLNADALRALPPFCRVAATLRPTNDSEIKFEVWLPSSAWNGKFEAVGNGAFSGAINYGGLVSAITRGYAASSTDTGHSGAGYDASFALGHPEKVIDFGWRAVHEMTTAAKKIIAAYYNAGPRHSYWNGCSAGGRQAMKEAQRFPEDFDGIVAGAPALDWTSRAAQAVRIAQHLENAHDARLLENDRERLHRAVVDACDANDGVTDGLLADPGRCEFDPATLRCDGSNQGACLGAKQVETARLIYSAMTNAATGRAVTGLQRGSELGWTDLGWSASAQATGLNHFRFLVFRDPKWEISQFKGERDIARAEAADADTINALDANLKPFIDHGGKLIQYHGWSDPQISPGNSTQYYARVLDALGGRSRVHNAYRLFMTPGMGHCGGGEGPSTFDMLAALEQWVEHGHAPDQIIATHSTNKIVDRTRPLCPSPEIAVYSGSGSINDASNFVCRDAGRDGNRRAKAQ
jgi:feruloyl esterase